MDERLEKAIQTANYMATLNTQKKLAYEEFLQNLIYYHNGASFTVSQNLISFIKTLIELKSTDAVILDDNKIPVHIENLQNFLDSLLDLYTKTANSYFVSYNELKKKRRIEDLVNL